MQEFQIERPFCPTSCARRIAVAKNITRMSSAGERRSIGHLLPQMTLHNVKIDLKAKWE